MLNTIEIKEPTKRQKDVFIFALIVEGTTEKSEKVGRRLLLRQLGRPRKYNSIIYEQSEIFILKQTQRLITQLNSF